MPLLLCIGSNRRTSSNSPFISFIRVNPPRTDLLQVGWKTMKHRSANNWGRVTGLKYWGHVSATLLYMERGIEIWKIPTHVNWLTSLPCGIGAEIIAWGLYSQTGFSRHCPKHYVINLTDPGFIRNSLANILGCKRHHIQQNFGK